MAAPISKIAAPLHPATRRKVAEEVRRLNILEKHLLFFI
jgi:hypothetical protein